MFKSVFKNRRLYRYFAIRGGTNLVPSDTILLTMLEMFAVWDSKLYFPDCPWQCWGTPRTTPNCLGSPVTCVSILYSESRLPLEEEQDGDGEEKVDEDEPGEGWVAGGSREGDVLIWRLDGGRFSLSQQIPAHKRQVWGRGCGRRL